MRKCEYCNKELKRKPMELDAHWEVRRFCNKSCSAKFLWQQRKKNESK